MHTEALNAVRKMVVTSQYVIHAERPTPERPRYALDLGGANINGTARDVFDPDTTWFGLDIAPGPGVDIVADARTFTFDDLPEDSPLAIDDTASYLFDLVLCTELLEHVAPLTGRWIGGDPDSGWCAVLDTLWRIVKPGGFVFITCASTGRRPHGARGEHDVPAGEHYRNVHAGVFEDYANTRGWTDLDVEYNPNPGDLYAWLRK